MFEKPAIPAELDIHAKIRRLRADLQSKRRSPVALATELKALKHQSGLRWRQLDRRTGLSPTHRKLLLCLLALPPDMATAIRFGESTRKDTPQTSLSLKHARALYLLRDHPDQQRALYHQLTVQRSSANRTLRAVLAKRKGQTVDLIDKGPDPNLQAALDRLRYRLGTRVEVRMSRRGGEFVIEFYGDEDMIRVYDLLMK